MGRSYLFECPKCGYKAKASGGADDGLDFSIQTIFCKDCKKLHDAVVRLKIPPEPRSRFAGFGRFRKPPQADAPPFEVILNRLPVVARGAQWVQFKLRCPVSGIHRVQAWNDPGKCPKCGVFLEKSPLPFRLWT
jgi:hypothetical protein